MTSPYLRYNDSNVPILSKTEIDELGEKFVHEFCPKAMHEAMEIDIDRFAERYVGLKQDFQYLSHNGIYLGMTVFHDTNRIPIFSPETCRAEYISAKAGTVIIDTRLLEKHKEHRYRFTMGHEAAHGILHTQYYTANINHFSHLDIASEPIIRCRMDTQKTSRCSERGWGPMDWMEWQANRLASAILMPRAIVQMYVEQLHAVRRNHQTADDVCAVSKIFNVSRESARYRLQELGFINH